MAVLALAACGGGGGGGGGGENPAPDSGSSDGNGSSPQTPDNAALDASLRSVITQRALTGDPATPRSLEQKTPAQDPEIKLGQLLFFSHSLSADLSVSCATCHHMDLGGSDDLSIGVGVAPVDAARLGPDRLIDPSRDLDPAADGGPNMHRNSQTVFNSAMFDRSMTFDGRVFVLDDERVAGGMGQSIRTPESGNLTDNGGTNGLLETFVQFPLSNNNEMRGYLFSAESQKEYRQHLVERLRGERDQGYLSQQGPANWLALFREAFNQPDALADDVVTLPNVQRALAAYIRSMVFINNPWKRYLDGQSSAIPDTAKRGALLFYQPLEDGGLGCAQCHSGDVFSNEKFYNVGFPQIGRGFMRAEKDDIGRWMSTRREEDKYAFRVPSLLNIGLTAPYGHAGTFDTLADLLRYHVDPRAQVDVFDFTLSGLAQYRSLSVSYPNAQAHTRNEIAQDSFSIAEALLPRRSLTAREMADLQAFLFSLTDDCAKSPSCRGKWVPAGNEDPDGNLLVRNINPVAQPEPEPEPDPDPVDPGDPGDNGGGGSEPPADPTLYEKTVALDFQASPLPTFAEIDQCDSEPSLAVNLGTNTFVARMLDPTFGLYGLNGKPLRPHGFNHDTWNVDTILGIEPTMIAGGVTAAYLDGDCWLDLAYAGGDTSGMVFYRNRGWQFGQTGFQEMSLLADDPGTRFTGVATADLNGDFRPELLFGNVHYDQLPIYSPQDDGQYHRVASLSMSRNTYGISFGDYDGDGYPEMYLAHWFPGNQLTAPVFWKNNQGVSLEVYDSEAHLSTRYMDQNWNFSPQFADFNDDGQLDLALSSDFGTSVLFQNKGDGTFDNITDRNSISDENGMGSALGDYDNDGDLDWFVTSIFDPNGEAEANWGVTGNRLYRNDSTVSSVVMNNVTDQAGVADGNWGWGTCFADFNNDGFLDIFHVNGFGAIPEDAFNEGESQSIRDRYLQIAAEYQDSLPRLFINNGDGTFSNKAVDWGLVIPSDGRGITCLDYDRDGDMDIALLDHSHGLQFFSNQTGHTQEHFLSVRLVGAPPNTEALGARVHVTADVGNGHGVQTQLRVSMANTNFNGQNPPDLHFGLGAADQVQSLIIEWPGGLTWQCGNLDVNHFLIFDQRTPEKYPACQVQ